MLGLGLGWSMVLYIMVERREDERMGIMQEGGKSKHLAACMYQ